LDFFGRFGAFQWVTANPNKKNLVPVSGCVPNVSTRFFSPVSTAGGRGFDPAVELVSGIIASASAKGKKVSINRELHKSGNRFRAVP
jgi:hypothetical protein